LAAFSVGLFVDSRRIKGKALFLTVSVEVTAFWELNTPLQWKVRVLLAKRGYHMIRQEKHDPVSLSRCVKLVVEL